MARNAMGLIVGIVAAFIVTYFIQSINIKLFPFPEGLEITDMEGMRAHAETLPPTAHIVVLISHLLGTAVGAFVAVKVAATNHRQVAIAIACFIMVMGIVNIVRLPHPWWFVVIDLLIYLPSGLLGYFIGKKTN